MSINTNALAELGHEYSSAGPNQFGLFLGAGVNLPTDNVPVEFKVLSWFELLEALYKRNASRYDRSFDELLAAHEDDWPGLAETLIGDLPVEQAIEQLDQIIYDEKLPRSDKRSRLSKIMLEQAPNLQAAICFSSQIKKRGERSWTFKRNPKVGAVITTNYDFYFGAGWTLYQAFKRQWKVHTPFSENTPPEHGCIHYIHGYLPYRAKEKKEIVLTTSSYQKYYAPGSFARDVLMQVLRKYHLIFAGFSFVDPMVNELLQEMKEEITRRHFAFVDEQAAVRAEELGIRPIVVSDWGEIAQLLKKIYCAGLEENGWKKFGLDNEAYWERLKEGPK